MRSVSVKVPTKTVGFRGDLSGRTALAAFEQSVFNEMADSIQRRRFMTRSSPHPDSQTDGTKSRHVFGQNCESIGKAGSLNLIYHFARLNHSLACSASIVTRRKDAAK